MMVSLLQMTPLVLASIIGGLVVLLAVVGGLWWGGRQAEEALRQQKAEAEKLRVAYEHRWKEMLKELGVMRGALYAYFTANDSRRSELLQWVKTGWPQARDYTLERALSFLQHRIGPQSLKRLVRSSDATQDRVVANHYARLIGAEDMYEQAVPAYNNAVQAYNDLQRDKKQHLPQRDLWPAEAESVAD